MTSTSKIWKELTSILANLSNYHSLEVVDRVSETQLQVGENSNWIIWRFKGLIWFIGRLNHCYPLSPHDALKHHFTSLKNRLNFPTTKGFRRKISIQLFYQYITIFPNFSPTPTHLHPLQVENCDSNSRLVVDEGDNGKFSLERVKKRISVQTSGFENILVSN